MYMYWHHIIAFEELEIADDGEIQEDEDRNRTVDAVDLAAIKPSTELEQKLLQLLQNSSERSKQLQQQFEEYKTMVKSTFLSNIIDDARR